MTNATAPKTRKSKKGTLRITPDAQAWARENGYADDLGVVARLITAYKTRNDTPEKLAARIAKAEKALKADKAKLATAKRADN